MVWVVVLAAVLAAAVIGGGLLVRSRALRAGIGGPAAGIDPFILSEPWRRHVAAALSAQRRYKDVIRATAPGPRRDRLDDIARQVQRSIEECWEVARRGDELDEVLGRLDTSSLTARLRAASDDDEQASLRSQIDSAERIRTRRDGTDSQLRLLNVRLGELVAQAAEVSIGGDDQAGESLGSAVDDLVTQLHSLRIALDEVGGAASTTPPTSLAPSPAPSPRDDDRREPGQGEALPST